MKEDKLFKIIFTEIIKETGNRLVLEKDKESAIRKLKQGKGNILEILNIDEVKVD